MRHHARLSFLSLRFFHLKYSIDKTLEYLHTSTILVVVRLQIIVLYTLQFVHRDCHNCFRAHKGQRFSRVVCFLFLYTASWWLTEELQKPREEAGGE